MKKILGIGNALVDFLIRIDETSILTDLRLPKGCMTLIDRAKAEEILNRTANLSTHKVTGGSAANTVNGLARLKIDTGFIGKVGNDSAGGFFKKNMEKYNTLSTLFTGMEETGKSMVLISPDSERTMATYLGAAVELNARDMEKAYFEEYGFVHIEGYLVQNIDLITRILELASASGAKVSLDLSSYNIVQENLEFFRKIVRHYVDIVFANEEEAKAFTEAGDLDTAIGDIASYCSIAVVKCGADGSVVMNQGEKCTIDPFLAKAIDTTGAGDLYASGFFYGLALDYPLPVCGRIGSFVSSKVVEVIGTKMTDKTWDHIYSNLKNMV